MQISLENITWKYHLKIILEISPGLHRLLPLLHLHHYVDSPRTGSWKKRINFSSLLNSVSTDWFLEEEKNNFAVIIEFCVQKKTENPLNCFLVLSLFNSGSKRPTYNENPLNCFVVRVRVVVPVFLSWAPGCKTLKSKLKME